VTAPQSPLRERVRREMAAGMLLAAAEAGLAKAHVEDIARRAGVAVGTLYNYSKDRDGLLAAVLSSRIDELSEELRSAVARTAESPVRVALLELARTYLRFVAQRLTFTRILSEGELTQLKDMYPTSATLPYACWQSFRQTFREVMERGVVDGTLSATHLDLDLWLFMGLLRGVVMRDLRGQGRCSESDADRLVTVFFDGASA
jgi:AcrR family transcriptional regulator